VLLDPLYFSGVNTTYDGLSLGKTIVTCPSPYQRGRYTSACYHKLGLTDCVASNVDEYVTLANRLALDGDYRADLEQRIESASEVLFEDEVAVEEHQKFFSQLLSEARSRQTET
jgi:predicted O-linked N-acetylglucosamine transferase (SPINDLY family)